MKHLDIWNYQLAPVLPSLSPYFPAKNSNQSWRHKENMLSILYCSTRGQQRLSLNTTSYIFLPMWSMVIHFFKLKMLYLMQMHSHQDHKHLFYLIRCKHNPNLLLRLHSPLAPDQYYCKHAIRFICATDSVTGLVQAVVLVHMHCTACQLCGPALAQFCWRRPISKACWRWARSVTGQREGGPVGGEGSGSGTLLLCHIQTPIPELGCPDLGRSQLCGLVPAILRVQIRGALLGFVQAGRHLSP